MYRPVLFFALLLSPFVNATEPDAANALQRAAYKDDIQSAERLLRSGVNVNEANDLGATALWAASQNGSVAMVRILLAAGANPNLALLAGETPLMVAARSGYAEVAELLIGKGANLNARGARAQTALMWAAAQIHSGVVQVLLTHGADFKLRSEVRNEMMAVTPHGLDEYNRNIPQGGDTALLFAARSGDLASVKLLVAAGANVNDANAWGVSATVMAAHSDFRGVAEYLLEKGADPNAAAAGFTALQVAIMHRDEQLVAALLGHGADANAPLRTWTPTRRSSHDYNFEPTLVGATPFWLAARFTEPGIMRLLAKHGADPRVIHTAEYVTANFQHRKETTNALMAAVGMGTGSAWSTLPRPEREARTLDAVRVAVDLGVDVNAAGPDGRTALDAAMVLRFPSVVEFLTAKGAHPGQSARQ